MRMGAYLFLFHKRLSHMLKYYKVVYIIGGFHIKGIKLHCFASRFSFLVGLFSNIPSTYNIKNQQMRVSSHMSISPNVRSLKPVVAKNTASLFLHAVGKVYKLYQHAIISDVSIIPY